MADSYEVINCVLQRFPLPAELFPPTGHFWLTLYLEGSPVNYAKARPKLQACGWTNLCEGGAFAGLTYPKKDVTNSCQKVRYAVTEALFIYEGMGMAIGLIDADTAFDPSDSNFRNLYKKAEPLVPFKSP